MKSWLLIVLLLAGFAGSAQVQADDTSRAIMQLMMRDSTLFRQDVAQLATIAPTDKAALSEGYLKVGWHYVYHGLSAFALKYFLRATTLAEASGNKERIGWSYNALGSFYKNQRDFNKSLQYHTKALAIFTEMDNKHGIGSIYNGIGDVYENEGNYTEALKNYIAAINALKLSGRKETLMWPYFNVGEVYMFQGIYDSALLYYNKTLALQQEIGDRGNMGWTYNNLSKALIEQGKYAAAEQYALLSLHIGDSVHEMQSQINAHSTLSKVYEAMGNHSEALKHYKAFTTLQAATHNEEAARGIVRHQMQYDFDKKQEQAAAVQAEKDKTTYAIALLLVAGVIVLAIAFYLQQKGNKLKAVLLKQNQETLRQKEMLMKEIHHRVKNNLQITGVLLDMQLRSIEDEHAKAAIRESVTRLNTMTLIHHQLYRNDETSEIEFSQFATDLQHQLHTLFAKEGQVVDFKNDIPHITFDIDTAVPLGLILNELITNSYKHAFGNGVNTMVASITKGNDGYTLVYDDGGPGMQAESIKGAGLGMMIIRNLSRQIGGRFDHNAENKLFIVSFRDSAEMKKTA